MDKPWKIGLESFSKGEPSVVGIKKIWRSMRPPHTDVPLLAQVVGALWANTYWEKTKMSAANLARDIQAATNLGRRDAEEAATSAFQRWSGLYVRNSLSGDGAIPRLNITKSPDVVVNAQTTLDLEDLIRTWNKYVYTEKIGAKNNVYGRAQSLNLGVPITRPTMGIYYTDGGFYAPTTSWVRMFPASGSDDVPLETLGSEPETIQRGGRAATSEEVFFDPEKGKHYCLITVAQSEFFENDPLTQGSGNFAAYQWATNNGAAGWHNLNTSSSNEAVLKFYNQDGRPERFIFEAHCHRVAPGTEITLACHDLDFRKSLKISSSPEYQLVTVEGEAPPYYTGDLKVEFETPNGRPLPPGSFVEVRKYWHLPAGHNNYMEAANELGAMHSALIGEPVRIRMGDYTFVATEE